LCLWNMSTVGKKIVSVGSNLVWKTATGAAFVIFLFGSAWIAAASYETYNRAQRRKAAGGSMDGALPRPPRRPSEMKDGEQADVEETTVRQDVLLVERRLREQGRLPY